MDAGLLGSAVTFLTLASVMFGLRIYVRAILIKKWGTDDWLITCAMVAFVIYSASQITGIVFGIGRHLDDLTSDHAKKALMLWWLCELFYIPSTVFLKLSVGIFLHRIAIKRVHIWIIRFMMLASGLFGSAYLLLAIFQCRPSNAWWIQKHAPPASKDYGWCFDNTTVVIVTFISCSLNAVADCTFGLLPIFIVRGLQMPRKQKKLVAGILGFANVACIATIVRTPYTIKFFKDNDFLYETRTFALLSTIEPGVGIAAACVATLRPLLQRIVGVSASGWFSVQRGNGSPSKFAGTYTLGSSQADMPTNNGSNYIEISAAWRAPSRGKDPTITGKEMKHLYASPDLDSYEASSMGQSVLDGTESMANAQSIKAAPPSVHEYAETTRTDKTVGFTFYDEADDMYDESRKSVKEQKPLPALPGIWADRQRTGNSRTYQEGLELQNRNFPTHRDADGRVRRPPGAVGDPFGAWR